MEGRRGFANTNFVMFLRALTINALCLAIVLWAYREGWIAAVIEADSVFISRTIMGLGVLGLSMVVGRIFKVSRELNIARKYHELAVRDGMKQKANDWLEATASRVAKFVGLYRSINPSDKPILVEQFRLTMGSKLHIFGAIGEWLVMLGLVGTVVGMRLSVGFIDPQAFRDIELVVPLLKQVISGLYVAIDTTIVGACMALWLDLNLRWVLRPGTVQLINEAVEIGVTHG